MRGAAAMILFATSGSALAQSGGDPLPHSRTGADGDRPVAPDFPEPSPGIAAAAPSPSSEPVVSGSLQVDSVNVQANSNSSRVPVLASWTPPAATASGLRLTLASAGMLDARWVQQQFVDNGMVGAVNSLDRIAALVQLINLAYVQNGYVNSGVMILPSNGNTLNLRLILGSLVEESEGDKGIVVAWKGSQNGLEAGFVRNRMTAAREVPLNLTSLERDFRLLADNPAIRSVNADLRPGSRPGEATLALTVDPQSRGDLYIGYANNRSPSVGGERYSVGGFVRSLLRPGDMLSADYGKTKGLDDVAGSYAVPLFGPDWSLRVRGGYNEAAVVETALIPLDIRSKEWSIEGGILHRVIARPLLPPVGASGWRAAEELSLGAFVEHRKVRSSLLGKPFSFSPGSVNGRTEYTTLRLSGDYTRRAQRSVLAMSLTGTLGLDGTRSTIPGLLTPSRHFTAALLQANFARRLNAQLLELRLRFAGQIASGILYAPERFSAGGIETVRGFRENLVLADEVAVGSIELAQPFTIGSARTSGFSPGRFTISAYVDGAMTHNKAGVRTAPKSFGSAGVGLQWAPANWLSARINYAKAFNRVRLPVNRDVQDKGVSFRLTLYPLGLFRGAR